MTEPSVEVGPDGAVAAPSELPDGSLLDGRYLVRRVIGRGGFGITYEMVDTRLQRAVAVKEMFPPAAVREGSDVRAAPHDRDDFRAAKQRFLREARLLARFSHPGIVRVYEVFEANNSVYLVMELLEGCTLAELLQRRGRPFSAEEVLDVAARVGSALAEVHVAGLLHRDVNPSNVMVTTTGRVVLIDFGLARRYGDEATAAFTRVVTPGYAPPEQYAGSGAAGPTTDVYGLAATLYRLLTVRTPANVFDRHAGQAVTAPAAAVSSVPKLLSDAVLDGLELNPSHRPASAEAFLDRLGLHGLERGRRALLAADVVAPAASASGPRPPAAVERAGAPPAVAPAAGAGPVAAPGTSAMSATAAAPAQRRLVAPPVAGPAVGGLPAAGGLPVVGPHPRARRWTTVPSLVAAAALASSTPVLVVGILLLVVLPTLATIGDVNAHRWRRAHGVARRAWHRAAPASVAPVHALRNVVLSVMRGVPALAIGGVVVLAAHLAGDADLVALRDIVVRAGGALVACTLLVPARHDGRGFRTGTGLSVVVSGALDERGHVSGRGWTWVVVCVALTAAGLWLHPELWPLPH